MKAICLNQPAGTRTSVSSRRSGSRFRRLVWGASVLSCLILISPAGAQSQRRRGRSRPAPTAQQAGAAQDQAAPQKSFEQLAAEANAAREADRIEEAVALYRQGVALRPRWAEGWWYLATLYYDQNRFAEAARAFRETAQLQQRAGAPWAMLGLCEFQLARYDESLMHIQQGRQLGLGDNAELTRVMRYHEGVLSILKGEFEKAQQTLGTLSYEGLKSEDLIIALGLAVLRLGMLPKQVDVNYRDRDLIRRAGLAEHFAAQRNMSDAQREYDMFARD